MEKKRLTLLGIFSILLLIEAYAQVVMGSDLAPAEYVVLQLDGECKGLRLSQLSQQERDNLPLHSDKANAHGLVIFNRDTKQIEYWDGTAWNTLKSTSFASNGLKLESNQFMLGGDLTQDTEINLANHNLNFNTSGGNLIWGDNNLKLDANTHNIGLSVANPKESLDVNGRLKVKLDNTTITNSDGTQNNILSESSEILKKMDPSIIKNQVQLLPGYKVVGGAVICPLNGNSYYTLGNSFNVSTVFGSGLFWITVKEGYAFSEVIGCGAVIYDTYSPSSVRPDTTVPGTRLNTRYNAHISKIPGTENLFVVKTGDIQGDRSSCSFYFYIIGK